MFHSSSSKHKSYLKMNKGPNEARRSLHSLRNINQHWDDRRMSLFFIRAKDRP